MNRQPVRLSRSVQTWRKCQPSAMVVQSTVAIENAFFDARHDILALADHVRRLEVQIAAMRACAPGNAA